MAFLINISIISVSGSVCSSSDLSPEDRLNCEDLDLNKASFLLKVPYFSLLQYGFDVYFSPESTQHLRELIFSFLVSNLHMNLEVVSSRNPFISKQQMDIPKILKERCLKNMNWSLHLCRTGSSPWTGHRLKFHYAHGNDLLHLHAVGAKLGCLTFMKGGGRKYIST